MLQLRRMRLPAFAGDAWRELGAHLDLSKLGPNAHHLPFEKSTLFKALTEGKDNVLLLIAHLAGLAAKWSGHPDLEGSAIEGLGDLAAKEGDTAVARARYEEALVIWKRIRSQVDEARAQASLAGL